jgi:hypothetical protein
MTRVRGKRQEDQNAVFDSKEKKMRSFKSHRRLFSVVLSFFKMMAKKFSLRRLLHVHPFIAAGKRVPVALQWVMLDVCINSRTNVSFLE